MQSSSAIERGGRLIKPIYEKDATIEHPITLTQLRFKVVEIT
jgi:hypothetical protein